MHDSIHMANDIVNAKLAELRRSYNLYIYCSTPCRRKKTSELIFVTTTWNFHQIS